MAAQQTQRIFARTIFLRTLWTWYRLATGKLV